MLNEHFLNFLLIFFPGIIGISFIKYILIPDKKIETIEWIIYSFVLGILSYMPVIIYSDSLYINKFIINIPIILIASLISLFYSLFIIKIINSGIIHKFFDYINLSNNLAFKHILNNYMSKEKAAVVHVTNLKNNIIYSGEIIMYEIHDDHYTEILLCNTTVTDSNDNFSYDTDKILIYAKSNDLIIEFPKIEN